MDRFARWAALLALVLALFTLAVIKSSTIDRCNFLLDLPKVENEPGAGGAIGVDDLAMCKIVMQDKFPALLAHLAERTSDTYLVVLSDHPFYALYRGEIIFATESRSQTTDKFGLVHNEVHYWLPELYGLREIKFANCGDRYPVVDDDTLVIYPCSK